MSTAQFLELEQAKRFILGGNARLTLVSRVSGTRFTFKVSVPREPREGDTAPDGPWFVGVLSGPDNTADYAFLGTIFAPSLKYNPGRKSRVSPEAPSARAWVWFWKHVTSGTLPDTCEVWHEGRCGRCGRLLTVPESIATGIGPVCAGRS